MKLESKFEYKSQLNETSTIVKEIYLKPLQFETNFMNFNFFSGFTFIYSDV